MLRQASVGQLRRGEIARKDGTIVITMRFYPRGLRKELRDEYRADLAPDAALFKDFKRWQKEAGQEEGFRRSRYDERFSLSPQALERLKQLADLSQERDVFLVCQCEPGERCHREILLLLAKKRFGASIDRVRNEYPRTRILRSPHP